jgi:hypothetical protein
VREHAVPQELFCARLNHAQLLCGVPTNEAQHHLAPFAAGVDAAEAHDEVGVTQKLVAVSLVGVMV